MKVYLANSLFSEADRDFNIKLATKIRETSKSIDLYVPQENMEINDKSKVVTAQDIADGDMKHLIESDVLVAVIDGVEIDSGVAAEIGAFYMTGKPIYALCTDIRTNTDSIKNGLINDDSFENPLLYRNLFVTGLIKNRGGYISKDIDSLCFGLQLKIVGVKGGEKDLWINT